MNKAELRASQRQRLRALSPEFRVRHAALLCERLQHDPRLGAAKRIGIYLALPDEPDLSAFYQSALAVGKFLALPFPNDDGSWSFRRIRDLTSAPASHWNLRLPSAGESVSTATLDVILVPGLAFSSNGTRLGRGKGIYDRLLVEAQGLTLGCVFPEHIVDILPFENHDIRLNEVWVGGD